MEWILFICMATSTGCVKEYQWKTDGRAECFEQARELRVEPSMPVSTTVGEATSVDVQANNQGVRVVAACVQRATPAAPKPAATK